MGDSVDYKKILKNQQIRMNILKFLKFIPDKQMLKIQYKIKFGRNLDFKNCHTFTEKIQKYKISYRNPILHKCVDKIDVKQYIREKGLANILIPTICVADEFSEINRDNLPNEFIIKTSNGSQTNIICKNKDLFDFSRAADLYEDWLKRDYYIAGREWAYKDLKPRILIEELLDNSNGNFVGIEDYKFLCFNGHVEYIVVDVDRDTVHKRNIYNLEWENLEIGTDCPKIDRYIEKPSKLSEMIDIAERLSEDFPFVRVDLYQVKEKVYFGELTFYPWSGYVNFSPEKFDLLLGKNFII